MAKNVKIGDAVKGYTILALINKGNMANAYAARAPSGDKVFFKQYKSPSIAVAWYRDYVAYQQELKRRVESSAVRDFSYRMLEFFEAEYGCRTFFQVFEFVKGGLDMEQVLARTHARGGVAWEQRVILAKVMMNAIAALHDARIVHADLKPTNLQLFPDATIKSGYQLKLIDMDFSVLSDRRAPWHGQSPYVGSPHYFSPEHLAGQAPLPASDVFTCGLILYELLGAGHPYWTDDEAEYAEALHAWKADPPKLAGAFAAPASSEAVADCLRLCLCPNPAKRPTARYVNHVLTGRVGPVSDGGGAVPESMPVSPPASPPPPVPEPAVPASSGSRPTATRPAAPSGTPGLELMGESGQKLVMSVRTEIGKALCQPLGPEAQFWDTAQCTLAPVGTEWQVAPNPAAKNETLLNGKAVTAPTELKDGDVLAVGREAKGIAKLPLTVRIWRKA